MILLKSIWLAIAAAALLGVGLVTGSFLARGQTTGDYRALRIQAARVASALGGGSQIWQNLSPLLSPKLAHDTQLEKEVAAWERRDQSVGYSTPVAYVRPDVMMKGSNGADVQLTWEYGEADTAAKGNPQADWLQVIDLTFSRERGRWLVSSIATQEIGLVSDLYANPDPGSADALVVPPKLSVK